jgi:serine/threonine-protein kinase
LLGRYTIEGMLGEGGLGTVYRAQHRGLGRAVAVKVLRHELVQSAELRDRFAREVKTLSLLSHPHIVSIVDSGVEDGAGFLVMELLSGETLEARVDREGAMAPSLGRDVARQVLLGLVEAHARNILHRDLKPANVFIQPLGNGGVHVKILDFGLAKLNPQADGPVEAFPTLTADGTIVGTPTYMAPEQAAASAANERSDLYSVGIMLFEMLAGRPPFRGETKLEVLRAHLTEDVPSLVSIHPGLVPVPELERFLGRALAKDHEARFESASQMLGALDALPVPMATETGRPPERRRGMGTEPTIEARSSEIEIVEPSDAASTAVVTPAVHPPEARAPEARAPKARAPKARAPKARAPKARPPKARADGTAKGRGGRRLGRVALVVAVGVVAVLVAVVAGLAVVDRTGDAGDDTHEGSTSFDDEGGDGPSTEDPPNRELDRPDVVAAEERGGVESGHNPFADATLPEELRDARRATVRGRWLSRSQVRAVQRFQRRVPRDPRPSLVLARSYRLQNDHVRATRSYLAAHRIDPQVKDFAPMLPDLVRAAMSNRGTRAATAVVDVYGADALPEIARMLARRDISATERRRLEALEARVRGT